MNYIFNLHEMFSEVMLGACAVKEIDREAEAVAAFRLLEILDKLAEAKDEDDLSRIKKLISSNPVSSPSLLAIINNMMDVNRLREDLEGLFDLLHITPLASVCHEA